jgi:hypothetical protein
LKAIRFAAVRPADKANPRAKVTAVGAVAGEAQLVVHQPVLEQ